MLIDHSSLSAAVLSLLHDGDAVLAMLCGGALLALLHGVVQC